jgi:hypothetical protein
VLTILGRPRRVCNGLTRRELLLAGAGVRGGSVYGRSDKDAGYPVEKPVSPEDRACTVYEALGIDPHGFIPDKQDRPVALVDGCDRSSTSLDDGVRPRR